LLTIGRGSKTAQSLRDVPTKVFEIVWRILEMEYDVSGGEAELYVRGFIVMSNSKG